jgi:glycine/D-amino acid oxidase-like deaminating enzyme
MGDETYDVVVIGGGIVGSASAHYLARRGLAICLIERGEIGREQSSRNWGFVRQQGRHPVELPLMIESNRMWRSLQEELDADVEWVQGGNLALASDSVKMRRFFEWQRVADDHGLETHVLGPEELRLRFPNLSGGFAGAMYTPSDGHASPEKVSPAFAAAALRAGATVLSGEAVESILTDGGSVTGVATERRRLRARHVVCAAGAYSSRLLRPLGVVLPQRIVRATVAMSQPVAPLTRAGVWADDVSFRQRRDGRVVFAAGARADYDLTLGVFRHLRHFLPNYLKNRALFRFHVGKPLLADLAGLIPGSGRRRHPFSVRYAVEPKPNLRRVERGRREFSLLFPDGSPLVVERAWAGNVDATPDAVPVIDALERPRGLVVATGFSGHGFALGPVTGRLVSELVTDGRTSLDLHSMRLSRFAEGDLVPPRSVL